MPLANKPLEQDPICKAPRDHPLDFDNIRHTTMTCDTSSSDEGSDETSNSEDDVDSGSSSTTTADSKCTLTDRSNRKIASHLVFMEHLQRKLYQFVHPDVCGMVKWSEAYITDDGWFSKDIWWAEDTLPPTDKLTLWKVEAACGPSLATQDDEEPWVTVAKRKQNKAIDSARDSSSNSHNISIPWMNDGRSCQSINGKSWRSAVLSNEDLQNERGCQIMQSSDSKRCSVDNDTTLCADKIISTEYRKERKWQDVGCSSSKQGADGNVSSSENGSVIRPSERLVDTDAFQRMLLTFSKPSKSEFFASNWADYPRKPEHLLKGEVPDPYEVWEDDCWLSHSGDLWFGEVSGTGQEKAKVLERSHAMEDDTDEKDGLGHDGGDDGDDDDDDADGDKENDPVGTLKTGTQAKSTNKGSKRKKKKTRGGGGGGRRTSHKRGH